MKSIIESAYPDSEIIRCEQITFSEGKKVFKENIMICDTSKILDIAERSKDDFGRKIEMMTIVLKDNKNIIRTIDFKPNELL
jgi:hypothetical protein